MYRQKLKRKSYANYEEIIEGVCVIYTRTDVSSDSYYVRMSFPGRTGYEKESLDTVNRYTAIEQARKRYWDLRARYEQGFSVGKHSFCDLYEEWIQFSKDQGRSPTKYEAQYKRFFREYFKKIVGLDDIQDIKQAHLDGYWKWRRDYWKNYQVEQIKDKRGRNRQKVQAIRHFQKRPPAWTTMELEKAALSSFFKWTISRGYLQAGQDPIIKNPVARIDGETWKLRGHIELADYRKIITALDAQCKEASKSGKGSGRGHNPRRAWYAEQMRMMFQLITATGLRPQEAKLVRWEWIKLLESPQTGKLFCVIDLPAYATKRTPIGNKSGRRVFAFDNERTYNRLMKKWWPFCLKRGYTRKNLVFGTYDDPEKVVPMGNKFVKFLKRQQPSLHLDKDGRPRSLYAARKFYINSRIKHGTPLPAIAKNTGHDVQTLWKWYQQVQTDDMYEYLTTRKKAVELAELVELEAEKE